MALEAYLKSRKGTRCDLHWGKKGVLKRDIHKQSFLVPNAFIEKIQADIRIRKIFPIKYLCSLAKASHLLL